MRLQENIYTGIASHANVWLLDLIVFLSFSFPHMLALCILEMNKPKHGEDYFQESFHVLTQRPNKAFWKKREENMTFLSHCPITWIKVHCVF